MGVKNVLVTGAAGYLAGFVIERLRERYSLTLMDRVEPDARFDGHRFVRADVTDLDEVERACAGQDAVVHLIALVRERFDKPPAMFADVMVKGTWHVAEACVRQGVRRLVNISSIIACGAPVDDQRPYRVGDPCEFRASDLYYCLAKSLGEQVGLAYHQAHGLYVIHLRPGVIFGDGLNDGPNPVVHPDGPWFVYVHPRDIAQAVEAALETDIEYGCYQIVAGRRDSRFDWTAAAEELGYRPSHNWPEIPEVEVRS